MQQRLSLAEFLSKHPKCCFCGGDKDASDRDHVPGRGLFINRVWPEDYEFPSCRACNECSRHLEQIVAFLAYANGQAKTEDHHRHFREKLEGLRNNWPGLLRRMKPSARELRNFLRKRKLVREPGTFLRDLPIVRLTDSRIQQSVLLYARKITCALHYLHTRQIIHSTGAMYIRWYTNVNIYDGSLRDEIFQIIPGLPRIVRSTKPLGDQFNYQYTVSQEGDLSGFVIRFPESLAIVSLVSFRRDIFAGEKFARHVFSPLSTSDHELAKELRTLS